jgi:hypothetical protein
MPIVGGPRNGEVVELKGHVYVQVDARTEDLDTVFYETRLYVRRYWFRLNGPYSLPQIVSVLLHPSVDEKDLASVHDAVMIACAAGWLPGEEFGYLL